MSHNCKVFAGRSILVNIAGKLASGAVLTLLSLGLQAAETATPETSTSASVTTTVSAEVETPQVISLKDLTGLHSLRFNLASRSIDLSDRVLVAHHKATSSTPKQEADTASVVSEAEE